MNVTGGGGGGGGPTEPDILHLKKYMDLIYFFSFLTIFICIHDMRFTILSTINIFTYNIQSTNHNNYIYIVNHTYHTYKAKSALYWTL